MSWLSMTDECAGGWEFAGWKNVCKDTEGDGFMTLSMSRWRADTGEKGHEGNLKISV